MADVTSVRNDENDYWKGQSSMRFGKHGLRVLGLSFLAVLGLTLSASAQAADFLENSATLNTLLTATGEIDLLLRFEVPVSNLEIDCTALNVTEGDLLGTGAGEERGVAHVKLLFLNCLAYVLVPLEGQPGCKLFPTAADRTAGTNEGDIRVTGLVLVFLHTDGKAYLRLHGLGEDVLTQIFSTGCIGVPNGIKVKGLMVFKLHNQIHAGGSALAPDGETNREKQLIEMADLTLFPNALRYGENIAELLGSLWVKLSNNNPWGIC